MAPRPRKRVDAGTTTSLMRARDGSGFTRCAECNKDVPVVLIDMHSCSLDSRIKMHLESQAVETEVKKTVKPAPKKRKAVSSEKTVKKGKYKDPNRPKRPPTAFFLFMDDFRKEYKLSNPGSKGVTGVTKDGGLRWKSLTVDEKQVYIDRAAERKAEHEKAMEKYKSENEEKDDEVQEISDEEDDKDDEETEENKDEEDAEANKDDEEAEEKKDGEEIEEKKDGEEIEENKDDGEIENKDEEERMEPKDDKEETDDDGEGKKMKRTKKSFKRLIRN